MSIEDFPPRRCLEFLAKSELRLNISYKPETILIGSTSIEKLDQVLPHWYIAPNPGEELKFQYLRDLHARFQVLSFQQGNGNTKFLFVGEQAIDIYQTSFGLPSRVSFFSYEIESSYQRSLRRLHRTTVI